MDYLTCAICGTSNELTYEVCKTCGSPLDLLDLESDSVTLTNQKTVVRDKPTTLITKRPEEPDKAFGFGISDLEFVNQGVSVNAAEYLKERFRPISPISKGGMGKLFLVQEVLSGRFVALKVMLERALNDISLVHQFVREAVITARLQHPHIIPVHELGFLTEGQLYYTMRYVDGNTLDDITHKIDLEERLRILRSAATAVDHAHEQGLWHRDLKPNNILVGSLGDTYVIDWGLVSVQPKRDYKLNLPRIIVERELFVMPDNLLDDTREAVSTITGRIVGTPAYMSPEQVACEDTKMGSVSDVWAFGVMLFEAITGRHPIDNVLSLRPYEVLEHVMYDTFPSPKDISKDIPEVLDSLCQRMLNKNPSDRMQTLKEFIEELTHYLKYQGQTIAGFGTFSQLPKPEPEIDVAKDSYGKWKGKFNNPEMENEILNLENERLRKKVEILVELAQLDIFSGRRKKELWADLTRL